MLGMLSAGALKGGLPRHKGKIRVERLCQHRRRGEGGSLATCGTTSLDSSWLRARGPYNASCEKCPNGRPCCGKVAMEDAHCGGRKEDGGWCADCGCVLEGVTAAPTIFL